MPREESAQRRGNFLGRTVAAIKPEAQPRPRQDSQRDKDAWDAPITKGLMAEHVDHACGETSAASILAWMVRVAKTRDATAAPSGTSSRAACWVLPRRCRYPAAFRCRLGHFGQLLAIVGRAVCAATQRSEQGRRRPARMTRSLRGAPSPKRTRSDPPRQAQRAGVKDRSRRAVTAMTARGAAREPGGAGRRHARNQTCRTPQPTLQDEAALVRIPGRLDVQVHQQRFEIALAMEGLAIVLNPSSEFAFEPTVGRCIG